MGESQNDPLRVDCDRHIKLEFHGSTVTSDAGLLASGGAFLGKNVATVLSRAYDHPLEPRPKPQAAFVWERSAQAFPE